MTKRTPGYVTVLRVAAVTLSMLGCALVTAVAAPAAQASPAGTLALRNGICEAGEFCLYRDSNRTGPVIDWASGRDDATYNNDTWPIVGGGVNDRASSYWNRTGCNVRIHRDSNANGAGLTVGPNRLGNLAGTPVGGDQASSHNACV